MRENKGIEYTCLYSSGGLKGGELFSGGAAVGEGCASAKEMAELLGSEIAKTVRWMLEDPPKCVMLYIQTLPGEEE